MMLEGRPFYIPEKEEEWRFVSEWMREDEKSTHDDSGWSLDEGESVWCMKYDAWCTKQGEEEGKNSSRKRDGERTYKGRLTQELGSSNQIANCHVKVGISATPVGDSSEWMSH